MLIEEQKGELVKMDKDIINRRLQAAKKQIESMQKKVNAPEPVQKQTVNTVPAGVPQTPPEAKDINAQSVPGVIVGGPRVSKKMKEV
tara:strand:- start:540 stop:800 length:261 start_codon:yes stop_codon:yes gene_type:complete